jgi:hypothetical protein
MINQNGSAPWLRKHHPESHGSFWGGSVVGGVGNGPSPWPFGTVPCPGRTLSSPDRTRAGPGLDRPGSFGPRTKGTALVLYPVLSSLGQCDKPLVLRPKDGGYRLQCPGTKGTARCVGGLAERCFYRCLAPFIGNVAYCQNLQVRVKYNWCSSRFTASLHFPRG